MVVDALVHLGRADAVEPWLDRYAATLTDAPEPREPIPGDDWEHALGTYRRFPDWVVRLDRELAEGPWDEVLAVWIRRLLPGVIAAATHGPIRTFHAARAMRAHATDLRRGELARGLAYWAATYEAPPGRSGLAGTAAVDESVDAVTAVGAGVPLESSISDTVGALHDVGKFSRATALMRRPDDVEGAFDELVVACARGYLANAAVYPIPLVHAVTAPSALRDVLPALPSEDHLTVFGGAWQSCAALLAIYGAPASRDVTDTNLTTDELADRAIQSGDDHAIKLTEACVRGHVRTKDPLLLAAAADVVERL